MQMYPEPPQPSTAVCVRHPDRPTGLACTRCGRPACPECLRSAVVGQHCVDCVRADQRSAPQVRTVAGAPVPAQPIATYALIALNTLVFAITVVQSHSITANSTGSSLFLDWELWPLAVADGQYGRVLGAGFLHFGPVHLLFNMFALYVVGRDIEIVLGRTRYLAVYLVSILGGSAAVMALQSANTATAGASGAIFGLFGAQAMILIRLRRSPGSVLAVIAINVVISITLPGISIWGHLGGLAAGTLATAGLLFVPGALARDGNRRLLGWAAVGAVALVAVVVIALRVGQLREYLGL